MALQLHATYRAAGRSERKSTKGVQSPHETELFTHLKRGSRADGGGRKLLRHLQRQKGVAAHNMEVQHVSKAAAKRARNQQRMAAQRAR